jgi:hypothetical protein
MYCAFQGRVLEGACDGDLVFDKDGKTRTSLCTFFFRFVSFSLAPFSCAPTSSCIFFLFFPGEQSRSKEGLKGRRS